MKDRIQNTITICCIFVAAFFLPRPAYATHVDGGELYYTHIGLDTYKITVVIFGNCGGQAFPYLYGSSAEVKVYEDPNTNVVATLSLAIEAPDSGLAILACPNDSATTCVNINNTIPGVKKFVYSTLYVLPHPSANWRFQFAGNLGITQAGRSSTITNVTNPGNTVMWLSAKLNNATADNSSAIYDSILKPYYCVNIASNYWPSYTDPDGDSLAFSLVPGKDGTGFPANPSNINYIAPYTPTSPMAATPFSFDNTNGHLDFTGTQVQRSLVVMEIDEYRNNNFVGSQMREMTVVVISACTTNPPCIHPVMQMGVSELLEPGLIDISPNPASDILVITAGSKIVSLAAVNTMGQTVITQHCDNNKTAINISGLSAGLYFIMLRDYKGNIYRERFLKE